MEPDSLSASNLSSLNTRVAFGVNASDNRSFDFARWYGRGCDEVALACQRAVEHLLHAGTRSPASVAGYCYQGVNHFLDFCAAWSAQLRRPQMLKDIERPLIEEFIHYLHGLDEVGYGSQKSVYSHAKTVLRVLCERGLLPRASELFPRNPYPHSNHRYQGGQPYTESERERLVAALRDDLVAIFQGRFEHPMSEALSICLLTLCLRAGRNTTPMLEMSRDAVREHPLVANMRLLVTYKRRGSTTHLTPLQWQREVDTLSAVPMDAVAIYEKVKALTVELAARAPAEIAHRLWLYRKEAHNGRGRTVALSRQTLLHSSILFAARHHLLADDGSPLVINPSRLRKTFVNRLWRLSGGDPFTVARLSGHSVSVLDASYLAVTPAMQSNFKFMGESLVVRWRGGDKDHSAGDVLPLETQDTPLGRCKDPYGGDLAPKNGSPCIDFLSCFGCKSFVITDEEQDLYRLYSFYWFLVRERERIGANRWAKVYGWIIRLIDDQVTFKFDRQWVTTIRQRAKDHPHPFWRHPQVMQAARVVEKKGVEPIR
jgi:integrase